MGLATPSLLVMIDETGPPSRGRRQEYGLVPPPSTAAAERGLRFAATAISSARGSGGAWRGMADRASEADGIAMRGGYSLATVGAKHVIGGAPPPGLGTPGRTPPGAG